MGLNEVLDLPTRRRLLFAMLKLRGVAPRWRVKYKHFEEFDLNEMEIRRALVDLTSEEGWISVGDEYLGHLGMTKTGDVGVITGVWCPKQDEIETYLPLYRLSFGLGLLEMNDTARDDDGVDMEFHEVSDAIARYNKDENLEEKEDEEDEDDEDNDEEFFTTKDFQDLLDCDDVVTKFKERDGFEVNSTNNLVTSKIKGFPKEGLSLENRTELTTWLETHVEMIPTANGEREARAEMHDKALRRMLNKNLKQVQEYERQRSYLIRNLDQALALSRRLVRQFGWTKRVSSIGEILYLDTTGMICCRSLTSTLDTMVRFKILKNEVVGSDV